MKKIVALFLSLAMITASSNIVSAQKTSDVENNVIVQGDFSSAKASRRVLSQGWGEANVQYEMTFTLNSKSTDCLLQLKTVGNSSTMYYGSVKNTTTGTMKYLNSTTTGAGYTNTSLGTLAAGTYKLYIYTYDNPGTEGVVWMLWGIQ